MALYLAISQYRVDPTIEFSVFNSVDNFFSGGITKFVTKKNAVTKWVMNRPYQTKFVESLMEASGITNTMSDS